MTSRPQRPDGGAERNLLRAKRHLPRDGGHGALAPVRKPAGAESGFTDLTQDWYQAAVAWAAHTGVTKGKTETAFDPAASVTREQLAAFLYRYAELTGKNVSARADLKPFVDAGSVSAYAADAMSWAVASGIIQGRTDTTLVPRGSATRAEFAAMLMRFAAAK